MGTGRKQPAQYCMIFCEPLSEFDARSLQYMLVLITAANEYYIKVSASNTRFCQVKKQAVVFNFSQRDLLVCVGVLTA